MTLDHAKAAETLFGGTTPTEEKTSEPVIDRRSAILFGSDQERKQALAEDGQPDRTPQKTDAKPKDDPKASHDAGDDGQPEGQGEPLTAEALGLDADNPLSADAVKTLGELGIKDKAAVEKLTNLQAKANEAAWAKQHAAWEEQVHAEFGEADIEAARAAVKTYGDDELRQLLNNACIGSHPAVVRAFARAGQSLRQRR